MSRDNYQKSKQTVIRTFMLKSILFHKTYRNNKVNTIAWIVAHVLVGVKKFLNDVLHENPSHAAEEGSGTNARTNWSSSGWPHPEHMIVLVVAGEIRAQIKLRGGLITNMQIFIPESKCLWIIFTCKNAAHLDTFELPRKPLRVIFNITTRVAFHPSRVFFLKENIYQIFFFVF